MHYLRTFLLCTAGMCLACPATKDGTTEDPTDTSTATTTATSGATSGATTGATTGPAPTTDAPTTDAPTTGNTTGPGGELCPEHPTTDACCCFETDSGYTANVCPATALCGHIVVTCSDEPLPSCPVELLTTTSDTAIDCALQALIDGKVGRIEWTVEDGLLPGFTGHEVVLMPVGDGTAFRSGYYYQDLGADVEAVQHSPLQTKAYFMDCLAKPSAAERFVCLRTPQTAESLEVCIEAHYADYF
ncbi:MAG: hypothetical protein IPO88_28435 [Nannocystis sp.]|uniref:hypothetical protein n=1 Tax=Nannocystis sp. TaxID=1962667 RepID=UPI002424509E|nr:hypothetical protein [Nannocystis sp.]MBK9757359.1 hypothetical protein [Nannocystis sp.]